MAWRHNPVKLIFVASEGWLSFTWNSVVDEEVDGNSGGFPCAGQVFPNTILVCHIYTTGLGCSFCFRVEMMKSRNAVWHFLTGREGSDGGLWALPVGPALLPLVGMWEGFACWPLALSGCPHIAQSCKQDPEQMVPDCSSQVAFPMPPPLVLLLLTLCFLGFGFNPCLASSLSPFWIQLPDIWGCPHPLPPPGFCPNSPIFFFNCQIRWPWGRCLCLKR